MQPQTKRSLLSRPRVLAVIGLVVVAAAVAWFLSRPGQGPGGMPAGGPPVTVSAPLSREVADWDQYTGQFQAVDSVELRARVNGYLTEIHFTDGQMVNKGDLLFVIDPRPYEIALANARAKLEQATASKEFAHLELGRAGQLRRNDFVSQSTLDQRVQDARGSGAGAQAAQTAVRDAELNLEFTRIEAPISGRISARQVSVGNLISGGGSSPTLLTTIVSLDPIYFGFDMSETDYLGLQRFLGGHIDLAGKPIPVEIQLSGETGYPHKGHLDFVDNQVDRSSGTIRARAVLDNPQGTITPGLFGRLRLAVSAPAPALLIPEAAVITDQSTQLLLTVAPDGTVVPKPVQLGQTVDGLKVVKSGLSPDDKVVINGLMRARPGSKVTAVAGSIEPGKP